MEIHSLLLCDFSLKFVKISKNSLSAKMTEGTPKNELLKFSKNVKKIRKNR